MSLASHIKANKEFFEKGSGPTVHQWRDWISRGVVAGKLIDGRPYVDLNRFAATDIHNPPEPKFAAPVLVDLLSLRRSV